MRTRTPAVVMAVAAAAVVLLSACSGSPPTEAPQTEAPVQASPSPTSGGATGPADPTATPDAAGASAGGDAMAEGSRAREMPLDDEGAMEAVSGDSTSDPPMPAPTATAPSAVAQGGWRTDGPIGGAVGQIAPNTTLSLSGGRTASLEEIAAGRPLLLYFFESW